MLLNANYKYMGGTSMSNPIVAGAATVVRDYYQKAATHSASAALVKATLINSAVDLADENNDGAEDNDFPIPNVHEGWGRVNLANATDGSHQYVDDATGVSTGDSRVRQFNVATAGQPFKVTLVWSDFPSTETAAQNLVNNLNLVVTAPDGAQYKGNVFSNGWSQTGGSADNLNNVENVYFQSAATGTWTVEVTGFNVPNGPQPFALVVDGPFGVVDARPSVAITNPADAATVSGLVSITADATDDNGVAKVEFFVNSGKIGEDTTAPYAFSWNSSLVADGAHVISTMATDSIGQTNSDSINVTTDNFNDDPVASFTYLCTAFSCNFDGSGSSDADGTIIAYSWNFGDGNGGSGQTTSHSYVSAGTYSVTLTVTDNEGATGGDTQSVTVSEAATTMHVGDLDGSSVSAPRNRWEATVTVTVHDSGENPVANATVDGTWSAGANGGGSCVTNNSGLCSVTKTNIKGNSNSVTFTVNDVTHASNTYSAGVNHDPDGDSDGTTVVVLQP